MARPVFREMDERYPALFIEHGHDRVLDPTTTRMKALYEARKENGL